MSDLRARIAEALRKLDYETTGGDLASRSMMSFEHWADTVLSLPGVAVVELPEAMPRGQTEWPDDAAFRVGERSVVRVFGKAVRWGDSKYPAGHARALAAALLAAADAADAADAVGERPGDVVPIRGRDAELMVLGREIAELKLRLEGLSPVDGEDEYHAAFAELVRLETRRRSL